MLENKVVEVVEDPQPEPEVDDKPELESEVVAELASLQEVRFRHGLQKLRVAYWDSCRSSSRVYYWASTIFGSYEGLIFLEITWCVLPIADLLQETSSQEIDDALVCGLVFSEAELSCYAAHYHSLRPVCHGNQFHTTLVSMWRTSAAVTATTMTRLRCFMRGALTRHGWVFLTPGEMMRTSHQFLVAFMS